MAKTTKAQLFIAQVLADTLSATFAGRKALYGTGAVVTNPGLSSETLGEKVQVPYFNSLGEFETLANDGDALTPAQITSAADESTVQHAGKAFEVTNWAQMAAVGDPYQEAANQMAEGAYRTFDKALITAASTTSLSLDITGRATKTWHWDAYVDAKLKWGDEQENIELIVCHSKVYGDMLKEKDADGRPLLVDPRDGKLPRYGGIPVMVSDRCTVNAGAPNTYESLVLKKGALALWYNDGIGVETDKDILVNSIVAAVHVYFVAHLYRRCAGGTKQGVVKVVTQ
ncbi:phage major capsid protein [Deinococcus cellulosilyticus]|uniref:Phage major capsid protein n=1 Tax=Deinococcus cellulosilyticus (strain DSM 18568 / NBRC 106333 / KACC 11606 / 5516J-15) TaxID=1223518 RepID=A0A511MW70_DEIC1|nr:phage major capsid protein [Deinococcus cellulosilyticus]GEM44823.1 hypothetical protein DC3_04580 [Deinococcus cellulosilyticus NBRC 106333 = KACC 11606]